MSQIEELQSRLTMALDRISRGLEAQAVAGVEGDDLEAVKQELEDERMASAQVSERLKALRSRRDMLEQQLHEVREQLSAQQVKFDAQLQAVRTQNEQLSEANAKLRDANREGVGEPHLINNGMMAELESLRALREADRAETQAVLDALKAAVATATATDDETVEDA